MIAAGFPPPAVHNPPRSWKPGRTCALIQAELDQAMARGRGRLADELIAEGRRVLEEGPLRKDEPGRGDVLSEQARAGTEPAEPS